MIITHPCLNCPLLIVFNIQIVEENTALIIDTKGKDETKVWKEVTKLPELLKNTITLGKLLELSSLLDTAQETVTHERTPHLEAALHVVYYSELSTLLGLPEEIVNIGISMGLGKREEEGDEGSKIVKLFSLLLPLLAKLTTSRWSFVTEEGEETGIHQGGLHTLATTFQYLGMENEEEALMDLSNAALLLPLDQKSGTTATMLLAARLCRVCRSAALLP